MIRRPIAARRAALLVALSVVALVAGYTWLSARQHAVNPNDTTIPSWSQLADGAGRVLEPNLRGERMLLMDMQATFGRLFMGLAIGVVGALLLGLHMGAFTGFGWLLTAPISLAALVPPTAALAVFFVVFGLELKMYVAMVAFAVLPVLAQTVHLLVRDWPEELQFKAYTLGASSMEVVWNRMLRTILPQVLDAVRLQIGPALVALLAAEMLVADVGFGYQIRLQQRRLDMAVVYTYLAVLAAFASAANWGLRALQRKLCRWYAGEGTA
ncbi:MAG: ABC transporter permease subunit [Myxococcales bacterium]|nr:ABC transporter permease subunit [Myxococcales bacterium]